MAEPLRRALAGSVSARDGQRFLLAAGLEDAASSAGVGRSVRVDRTTGKLLHFFRSQLLFVRLRLWLVRIRGLVHFRLLLGDDQKRNLLRSRSDQLLREQSDAIISALSLQNHGNLRVGILRDLVS